MPVACLSTDGSASTPSPGAADASTSRGPGRRRVGEEVRARSTGCLAPSAPSAARGERRGRRWRGSISAATLGNAREKANTAAARRHVVPSDTSAAAAPSRTATTDTRSLCPCGECGRRGVTVGTLKRGPPLRVRGENRGQPTGVPPPPLS
eukprot:scaffold23933_cov119-Isochrysis_galbana.AAC.5